MLINPKLYIETHQYVPVLKEKWYALQHDTDNLGHYSIIMYSTQGY